MPLFNNSNQNVSQNGSPSGSSDAYQLAQQRLAQLFSNFSPSTPQGPSSPTGSYAYIGGQPTYVTPEMEQNFLHNYDPRADEAQAEATMRGLTPALNEGPYGPSATGETAAEYQRQLASPYVTGLAQKLGIRHPRLAAMVDDAALGAQSAEASHERALAAGGGVEGFGGGLSDLFAGLTGPPQMRLAHRQQLEEMPLQYAEGEAQLQQAQSGTARNYAEGIAQLLSNPARVMAQMYRGSQAATIGANSRQMTAEEKYQAAINSDATKLTIAQLKGQYAHSNAEQQARLRQSFLGSYRSHLDSIDRKFDAQQAQLDKARSNPLAPMSADEYQARHDDIEMNREQEKEQEHRFFLHSSYGTFGQDILDNGSGPSTPAHAQLPLAPKQGTQLTDRTIASQYLKAAGGNKAKARQLAKQNGWVF